MASLEEFTRQMQIRDMVSDLVLELEAEPADTDSIDYAIAELEAVRKRIKDSAGAASIEAPA